uniref:C2H2-type domain-containing protein n=1 Tax=Bubo bubo TaxID=30461 RepID=A0A8C0EA94_BUBBB
MGTHALAPPSAYTLVHTDTDANPHTNTIPTPSCACTHTHTEPWAPMHLHPHLLTRLCTLTLMQTHIQTPSPHLHVPAHTHTQTQPLSLYTPSIARRASAAGSTILGGTGLGGCCWSRWLLFMCLKRPQLSPFGLPTGAGTDKQKEEQCQPREEQRGMLQGPEEEPQIPTVDVEHDGQRQPDDTQGTHAPRRPRKCSFKGTYAEDPQEATTQPLSSSRQQKYECEYCGKIFTGRRNLRRHQQIHTGEKRFQCQDCGKRFRRRDHLLSHQRTHTKEKPYFCTTCGKCFSFRSGLINHQHTHMAVRPNTFSHCGETFQMRAHLRELQQIHQNSEFLAGA